MDGSLPAFSGRLTETRGLSRDFFSKGKHTIRYYLLLEIQHFWRGLRFVDFRKNAGPPEVENQLSCACIFHPISRTQGPISALIISAISFG